MFHWQKKRRRIHAIRRHVVHQIQVVTASASAFCFQIQAVKDCGPIMGCNGAQGVYLSTPYSNQSAPHQFAS